MPVEDKAIGDLEQAVELYDEDLLVVEQDGAAKSVSGGLIKGYAADAAAEVAEEVAEEAFSSIDAKIDKAIIKRTASGNPATFNDGGDDLPIVSLVTTISPSQDGSGAPSPTNVRPIRGTDQITFYVNDDVGFPVSLERTVYGGTVDVVNGVLTVDRTMVNLGGLTWEDKGNNRFKVILPNGKVTGYYGQIVLCSCYGTRALNPASMNDYEYSCGSTYNHGSVCWLVIKDSRYSSESDFKSAMSGVQLVYERATPLTYQLTPHEANTVLGANTIYTGSGFPVTVTYRADPSIVIEDIIDAITSLGGNV